jgi:hypothetical protein
MTTDSTGAMETVTEVSSIVDGQTYTTYYVTDYSGAVETIIQDTVTDKSGEVYTYVQETTSHGVSDLTYSNIVTSGGSVSQ